MVLILLKKNKKIEIIFYIYIYKYCFLLDFLKLNNIGTLINNLIQK